MSSAGHTPRSPWLSGCGSPGPYDTRLLAAPAPTGPAAHCAVSVRCVGVHGEEGREGCPSGGPPGCLCARLLCPWRRRASGPLSEGLAGWLGATAGRSLAACGGTRRERVGRVRSPVRFQKRDCHEGRRTARAAVQARSCRLGPRVRLGRLLLETWRGAFRSPFQGADEEPSVRSRVSGVACAMSLRNGRTSPVFRRREECFVPKV